MYNPLSEYLEKREYKSEIDKAEELFQSKASEIQEIKGYRWYNAIKDYWISQCIITSDRLKTMRPWTDRERVQERLVIAEQFVSYLDNLENYQAE